MCDHLPDTSTPELGGCWPCGGRGIATGQLGRSSSYPNNCCHLVQSFLYSWVLGLLAFTLGDRTPTCEWVHGNKGCAGSAALHILAREPDHSGSGLGHLDLWVSAEAGLDGGLGDSGQQRPEPYLCGSLPLLTVNRIPSTVEKHYF